MKPDEGNQPKLKRSINLFQAVMYGVGLILGAGIYVLIGNAAGIAGNAVWISFLIASVVSAFTGMSYAELSSAYPRSAAEYIFVKNAMQSNLISFVAGSLVIISAIAGAAAVAIGFSDYLVTFLPSADKTLVAVTLVIALSAVNLIGIRESIFLNVIFTLVEISGLVLVIIAAGLFGFSSNPNFYFEIPMVAGSSLIAIMAASGLVFFAFLGFENLANISEETKNPQRTIPTALLLSILITTVLYIVVAISAISLVGWQALSSSKAPLALAVQKIFGQGGVAILSAIALFATSNTVLMMLISSSRVMYGMSRDGSLPLSLSMLHGSRRTPWISVAIACIGGSALVFASGGYISVVASVAVFDTFLVYVLVNLALIYLRYRNPQLARPFRQPVSIGRFPVLAGLGLVTSAIMLFQFDRLITMYGLVSVCVVIICFFVLSKR